MNIEPLIIKFLSNNAFSISKEELKYLETWIENPENESTFLEYVKINASIEKHLNIYDIEKAELNIRDQIRQKKNLFFRRKVKKVITYTAAASILLMVALSMFFNKGSDAVHAKPIIVNNTIPIGTDKATLTLEDGSEIALNKGQEYRADGIISNGEELVYDSEVKCKVTAYNTLTIPKGGQFHVILSDSTEVWLNSDSQIKYPVVFTDGKTRQVELIYGEAYFDVSPSTKHNGATFKVLTKAQEVEVLGTEFNIKAYSDENSIYTTLVEGMVAVDFGFEKETLSPNQQSILNIDNKKVIVDFVDVYNETSWKNGIFSFKGKALKDIMKDILLTIKNTNFINAYEIHKNTIILR